MYLEMVMTSAITKSNNRRTSGATTTFLQWRTSVAHSNAGERIKLIRTGVEANVLVSASEYFNMPRAQFVIFLGMSPATAERKIKNRSLLGPVESERLERLAIIEDAAEKVFGSAEMAKTWMMRKNLALGETPMSMLDTETGAGEVRKVLAAIAYGGVV